MKNDKLKIFDTELGWVELVPENAPPKEIARIAKETEAKIKVIEDTSGEKRP